MVVSLAPLLGWKDANWAERVEAGDCMVRVLFNLFKGIVFKFKIKINSLFLKINSNKYYSL